MYLQDTSIDFQMAKLNDIFTQLENILKNEGQSEFVSVIITNVTENDVTKHPIQNDIVSYQLLKSFLSKIFETIDMISTEILNDDTILVSVKNQKILRTCFQLVSCIGISTCLIPGLGIPLLKKCPSLSQLPELKFKNEEMYELLVECTNFFTRSYRVPVLRSIIITLHLSDYLAALIQLAFAPLKKPGTYDNYVMTQEMYDTLSIERKQFVSTYENLVANSFQPTLMKELFVLQNIANNSSSKFAKTVIAKELGRRLRTPGGILSLIRCLIDSCEIDTGVNWETIDVICKIVSTKLGTISEDEFLTNTIDQLMKILDSNNTHYLAIAVSCILRLSEKYPNSEYVKQIVKDIFQVFDYENLVSTTPLPGTIVLTPQEVDHKVNVLHACVSTDKLDWQVSLLMPNIQILFHIGINCMKNEDLKLKLKYILVECFDKLNKNEVKNIMNKLLFDKDDWRKFISIEEYDSGIAIKSAPQNTDNNIKDQTLPYFLDIVTSSANNELIKSVFEVSLDILIDLSLKRNEKACKDLLNLEEEPVVLDVIDEQYATILQLLSEISTSPRIVAIIKANPSTVVNFIEHFISKSNNDEECTTIALVLLTTVLSNTEKTDVTEKKFATLAPILKSMSKDESSFNHILCEEALSLMDSEQPQQSKSACGRALHDVFDNLLPVRAHGIMELTKLIDAKDAETISKKHYIFCIFQEQLKDPDSYIYLSAINGLASLCTHCPEDVLHVLCNEFLQLSSQKSIKTSEAQNKDAELRMKTGDIIVKVIGRLGEMAVVHKTLLLNTMLTGCRDHDPLVRASALSNLAEIARVLHYKMGTIIYEVLLCIWSIIETDNAVECRRAAVMVISSLLKGLGKDTLVQLKENLLPIYRTLKSLYKDNNEDSVVRLHAQIALEELNDLVNQFLSPELSMEKRIFVLDKPDDVFK